MTVIIALECEGIPILVADVLLTVPSRSRRHARDVPSTLRTYLHRRNVDASTVSGTVQKIAAFGRNRAVVGFAANDVAAAIRVIGRLSHRLRGANVSLRLINATLRHIKLPRNAGVSLLGCFINLNGTQNYFVWEQTSRTAHLVRTPFAIGSGAEDVLNEVSNAVVASAGPGLDTPLLRARAAAICCRTRVMGKEVDTAASISHHDYGGAFQAVLWDGTKFEYVEDFTTLFWVHDLESNQTFYRPMAIRHRQVGSAALFRRVEWEPIAGPFELKTDHVFAVPSAKEIFWPRAFPAASTGHFGDPLKSKLIANAILLRKVSLGKGWHVGLVDINSESGFVRLGPVESSDGTTQYGIQANRAFQELIKYLHQHYSKA